MYVCKNPVFISWNKLKFSPCKNSVLDPWSNRQQSPRQHENYHGIMTGHSCEINQIILCSSRVFVCSGMEKSCGSLPSQNWHVKEGYMGERGGRGGKWHTSVWLPTRRWCYKMCFGMHLPLCLQPSPLSLLVKMS